MSWDIETSSVLACIHPFVRLLVLYISVICNFQEREKFNHSVAKFRGEISEIQATLYDEEQKSSRLKREVDSKDSELEQLRQRLSTVNIDTTSINSGNIDDQSEEVSGKSIPVSGLINT